MTGNTGIGNRHRVSEPLSFGSDVARLRLASNSSRSTCPRHRASLAFFVVDTFVMSYRPRIGHVVQQQCERCGATFTPSRVGRPRKYCSAACRQRAWALRTAARTLRAGPDLRPMVVERVVEVERLVPVESTAPHRAVPVDVAGWLDLLVRLREQLQDDRGALAREHWKHRSLYEALVLDVTALGKAHPGGLDVLSGQRPRR